VVAAGRGRVAAVIPRRVVAAADAGASSMATSDVDVGIARRPPARRVGGASGQRRSSIARDPKQVAVGEDAEAERNRGADDVDDVCDEPARRVTGPTG
jgi:hypothetical protein